MIPLTAPNLVALAIQAGVLVLVGAPLPRALGIRSPRARLAYFRTLLLACLLLPFVQSARPEPPAVVPLLAGALERVDGVATTTSSTPAAVRTHAWLPSAQLLDLVICGIAARISWFLAGLLTLGRLRRRARVLEPRPPSIDDAAGLAHADAEFRQAATRTRPVTFGLLRPVVIVPSDFADFDADQQRAIACHELVHVRRRDWIRNVGDEVIRAVAWFHPAAWWLTREIRLAREQIVDQEVVRQTRSRKAYLDALLRLASPDRGSVLVPAPLFLGRAQLSDRIALLLKEVRMSRPRLALSFALMAAALVVCGRAVVAAFPAHADAAIQAPARPSVASQPGLAPGQPAPKKPGARVTNDVMPAFPAGSPESPLILSLSVNGRGQVTEVATVAGPADLASIASAAVSQWHFSNAAVPFTALVGFNPAAGAELRDQPPVLIGKTVKPPTKIKDVTPIYPAAARQARVQGIVTIETRIASDGSVARARILRSVPELNEAALTAVLQWKFTPLGFPAEMSVTVNFVLDNRPKSGAPAEGVVGGVPGGVKGGVPGGIRGGVAGGVPGGTGRTVAAAGTPEGGRVVRIGGEIKPPQKTFDVKPVYPEDAREARLQGAVVIEAVIDADGKVKDAKILRSVTGLDEAALVAVRQWEFAQTIVDGQPVSVIMTVTVNFVLQ